MHTKQEIKEKINRLKELLIYEVDKIEYVEFYRTTLKALEWVLKEDNG